MSAVTIIFYLFLGVVSIAAAGVLLSTNVFKSALYLLACLLGVAALYVFLFAEFVAVTQILIYAGGVLVVIIFGIMLTSRLSGKPLAVSNSYTFSGLLAGATLLGTLVYFIRENVAGSIAEGRVLANPSIEEIGINFMLKYSLPFELTGILLLVALIGAAVMTSFTKTDRQP